MRFFSALSLSLLLFLTVLVPVSAEPVRVLPDDSVTTSFLHHDPEYLFPLQFQADD